MEAAPGSFSVERIAAWRAAGINRVSLGVQSFVDAELRKIHEIVQRANAAGRAAAGPGAACAEVDKATRSVIEQAGYGQYFTHRTGHGIGLEAHEEPYVRGDNLQLLAPGMTFTVEPGIYLPNRGGVRIEDNVVITEDRAQSLSDLEREIIIVG